VSLLPSTRFPPPLEPSQGRKEPSSMEPIRMTRCFGRMGELELEAGATSVDADQSGMVEVHQTWTMDGRGAWSFQNAACARE